MNQINVTRSSMPPFEEYIKEIHPLWESRWLSNRGKIHRTFEAHLSEFLQAKNISLFANGHVALEVVLDAFNLHGEVITTPYTHCSTIHSLVRNGLKPVFCDIRETDFTINADQIEQYITEDTCAIMGVHVYGQVCDVDKVQQIADRHNLKVFYDAAHAFGVTINGAGVAGFGDFSMFSCHATKVFHTIEGGIAVVNNDTVFDIIDPLTNFGFTSHEDTSYVSTNARMNEFEAAMGVCNLRHFEQEVRKREDAAKRYKERLGNVRGIRLLRDQPGITWNYSYFPALFDGYKMSRDEIQEKLTKINIFTRKYFYPLVSEMSCYLKDYASTVARTPVAKHTANCVLTLPLYADLSVADVDRICDEILA